MVGCTNFFITEPRDHELRANRRGIKKTCQPSLSFPFLHRSALHLRALSTPMNNAAAEGYVAPLKTRHVEAIGGKRGTEVVKVQGCVHVERCDAYAKMWNGGMDVWVCGGSGACVVWWKKKCGVELR